MFNSIKEYFKKLAYEEYELTVWFKDQEEIIEGRNSISLYWKVASINSTFKILDVIVENTSYFVTKKSEFSKILRKHRGDIRKLTEEINKI